MEKKLEGGHAKRRKQAENILTMEWVKVSLLNSNTRKVLGEKNKNYDIQNQPSEWKTN